MLTALGVNTTTLEDLFDQGLLVGIDGRTARLGEGVDAASLTSQLPWSERRRLHERVASLLAPRPERFAEAARHYLAACRYPEARRLFVRVAEKACGEKRYAEAFDSLDESLRLWPADEEPESRLRVVREMIRCARNCGRLDVAGQALRELLEMAALRHDNTLAVETHQQLADLALLELDFPGAKSHLESAATLSEKAGPPAESAPHWYALASFLGDQIRPKEGLVAIHHAQALVGPKGDPALRSQLLAYEGLLTAMIGNAAAGRKLIEKALALAVEHRLEPEIANAYRRLANLSDYASDYAGERDAHLHAIRLCRKQGAKDGEQSCLMCLSFALFRMGEWKRALDASRQVIEDGEAHAALRAGSLGVRSMIAAFRGEHRQARQGIEEASLGLRRHGILSLEFHLLWAHGFSCEANGDEAEAAQLYGRLLDFWADTGDRHDVSPGAMTSAAFFADRGEWKRIAQATDILHAVVAANDNEETRAARFAVMGESAVGKGDVAAAIHHFASARDHYDRLGAPVERALIRRRLARALILQGREREASAENETATAIAKQLGLRPLLSTLATPSTLGAKSPAASSDTLTGRQLDVLRLLAAGLTNKEAADRLHLSPRTVEMHVAALLDRMNCRTRTEAIRRAGELGLLG